MRRILLRSFGAFLTLVLPFSVQAASAQYNLISIFDDRGPSFVVPGGDSGTWSGDANGITYSGTGFTAAVDAGPSNLFTWTFDDGFSLSGTGGAASGTFNCIEGDFGASVGANFCAGYSWGDNFIDEGGFGDDVILYPAMSLADFNGMNSNGNLMFSNAVPGITFTFAPVPVPAAVWLFGSALGLLGWMRRKAA